MGLIFNLCESLLHPFYAAIGEDIQVGSTPVKISHNCSKKANIAEHF